MVISAIKEKEKYEIKQEDTVERRHSIVGIKKNKKKTNTYTVKRNEMK